MSTVRTFIAIKLTPEVHHVLERVQQHLRQVEGGGVGRWTRTEGIHLTLKFLGETPEGSLKGVYDAVRRAATGHGPFDLILRDVGCFPNARRPRVIWVGVAEETGQLPRLKQALESELARLGYPKEGRTFTPHLTLARVKQGARLGEVEALGRSVAHYQPGMLARMPVDQITVIKSDLRPEGAVYTDLCTVPLTEGSART